MSDDIRFLLEQVKNGQVDVDAALLKLKMKPIEDLGYANVDLHRQLRQGVPEVIMVLVRLVNKSWVLSPPCSLMGKVIY